MRRFTAAQMAVGELDWIARETLRRDPALFRALLIVVRLAFIGSIHYPKKAKPKRTVRGSK